MRLSDCLRDEELVSKAVRTRAGGPDPGLLL